MVGGVYISPVVPAAIVALVATMLLSFVLTRIGFYRLVWHRPLVEVAIFAMLFALAAGVPPIGIAA